MNKWLVVGVVLYLISGHVVAGVVDPSIHRLEKIISGDHRSDANKARDIYRNPLATLAWLGVKEDMTIVEITPGAGWYAEILAPYVKDKGQYYGAGFDAESEVKYFRDSAAKFKKKLSSNVAVYGNAIVTELAPPHKTAIAPEGSADYVLTFRNVHNWMKGGYADDVFESMFKALKPGGYMGLVEHRGDESVPQDPEAKSGYVNQSYVIEMAKKAGFEFVASAEINANAKDTADHPKGVWTLPPRLALKDKDREKYLAIGESDRMTLMFRKP